MSPAALAFLLLASATSIGAVEPVARPLSYQLDVRFLPETSSIEGQAEILLEPPEGDRLVFFLHGELEVEEVQWAGQSLELAQTSVFYRSDYSLVALRVELAIDRVENRSQPLIVRWSGPFHPSRARSPSDYMRIDSTGVYLRAYGYSLWFPTFAAAGTDPGAVDFRRVVLRTPAAWQSVFAGELVSERLEDGPEGEERVTVWQAEGLALFAAQCTARPWASFSRGPLHVYSQSDEASRRAATATLGLLEQMLELMRARYKPQAELAPLYLLQMPEYGDISSHNVVGLSDSSWRDLPQGGYALRTLAHELVHPFVAVSTPREDPLWALAIEGFPSYFHLPILAEVLGEAVYDEVLNRVEADYLERRAHGADRWGPLPPEKPLLGLRPEDLPEYKDRFVLPDRGRLFFDWLRRELGREGFASLARALLDRHSLTAAELRREILRSLPDRAEDLGTWLDTTDYPEHLRRTHTAS